MEKFILIGITIGQIDESDAGITIVLVHLGIIVRIIEINYVIFIGAILKYIIYRNAIR